MGFSSMVLCGNAESLSHHANDNHHRGQGLAAFGIKFLMAALSLHSFDSRRPYPADVAGYHYRCPSGKSKTKREVIRLCGSSVVLGPFPQDLKPHCNGVKQSCSFRGCAELLRSLDMREPILYQADGLADQFQHIKQLIFRHDGGLFLFSSRSSYAFLCACE